MAVEVRHWCEAIIGFGIGRRAGGECGRPATVKYKGMWYCTKHDPAKKRQDDSDVHESEADPEMIRLAAEVDAMPPEVSEEEEERRRVEARQAYIRRQRTERLDGLRAQWRQQAEQRRLQREVERRERLASIGLWAGMPLSVQPEPKPEPPKEEPTVAEEMGGKRKFLKE